MSDDLKGMLQEILDGAREGRGWRERQEARMDVLEKTLTVLAHKSEEFSEIVNIHLENGRRQFEGINQRLLTLERESRGGIDVNVSGTVTSGAQTQQIAPEAIPSAGPAARASKTGAVAAGSGGVGGFLVWLVSGGGWDTLAALWKRLTG